MKEEKYINQLFKTAREEAPQKSYEEVAQQFENSLAPVSFLGSTKAYLSKFINLNLLIMITTISTLVLAIFWVITPTSESISINVPPFENQELSGINTSEPSVNIEESTISFKEAEQRSLRTAISDKIQQEGSRKGISTVVKDKAVKEIRQLQKRIITPSTTIVSKEVNPEIKQREEQIIKGKSTATDELDTSNTVPHLVVYTPENKTVSAKKITFETPKNNTPAQEVSSAQEVVFLLSRTDSEKVTNIFVETIRAYGFESYLGVGKRKKGNINKLNLRIEHAKGLNWRLKLQGFQQLEIKILLDENKNPYGITYRLNQKGQFAKRLTLMERGKSFHKFSSDDNSKGRHQYTKKRIE